MSVHALLVAPFEALEFMRAALVACFALALTNGTIGTLLILRRMSLDGDVLGHAVMPGAAIGFLYAGPSPTWLSLGGLASGLSVAALSGSIAGGRTRHDAGLVVSAAPGAAWISRSSTRGTRRYRCVGFRCAVGSREAESARLCLRKLQSVWLPSSCC